MKMSIRRLLLTSLHCRQQAAKALPEALSETQGFTLIELLVVTIIVGLLAAVAVPAYFGQVQKGKEVKAQTYLGSVNRAQQAHWLQYSTFSNSFGALGVDIPDEEYTYAIASSTVNYTMSQATAPAGSRFNNYVAFVYLGADDDILELVTQLCKVGPDESLPTATVNSNGAVELANCDSL